MRYLSLVFAMLFALSACTTQDAYTGENKTSKAVIGAGVGAAVGALGGLLVGQGKSSKDKRKAALIGAGLGALVGGGAGLYMDNKERALRQRLQSSGVSVTRNGDRIILNMPSNITFDTDQDRIKPQFHEVLNSVSVVFKEFKRTLINIHGHTDNTGSAAYNQQLSERRAVAVAQYLINSGTDQRRYWVVGEGETRPVASNATVQGREQNRRVEIEIAPL